VGSGTLILLDTHALLWLDQDDARLGPQARTASDDALAMGTLAVSAITFWETAILDAKGRVRVHEALQVWRMSLLAQGIVEIPVDGATAIASVQLDGLPGDPADRLIVATARLNGATLLTADRKLLDWPGDLQTADARL